MIAAVQSSQDPGLYAVLRRANSFPSRGRGEVARFLIPVSCPMTLLLPAYPFLIAPRGGARAEVRGGSQS